MTYNVNHYYNPAISRFTSEDPIGLEGGLNLQRFVNSNPINSIDPTGTITDINSFPGNNIPPQKYSEFNVTIYDYIGWTTKGMINSIVNAASGSGKSCPCEKIFWDCMREKYVPGMILEGLATATGNTMYLIGWKYAASQSLLVPLRSNIFRFWVNTGKNFGPTFSAFLIAADISVCLVKEISCLNKQ